MVRKLLTKKRVKTILNDVLKTVQSGSWMTKIDDDAVSYFTAKVETFFPLVNETDLLKVVQDVVPLMYETTKAFRRHRIISDDVEVAFIINTKREVYLREDPTPSPS